MISCKPASKVMERYLEFQTISRTCEKKERHCHFLAAVPSDDAIIGLYVFGFTCLFLALELLPLYWQYVMRWPLETNQCVSEAPMALKCQTLAIIHINI